ncbi:MAG: hypothetical protein ACW98K_16155 [Candidatus Kariarchaeaceae archaeon]|jgi:hypothetical protein
MPPVVELSLGNNYIISDKLFFAILHKLIESDDYAYTTDIEYTSAIDDSMIIKICSNDRKLTIARHGSNDDIIKLHGEHQLIREFLHDLAIEATSMIFKELCSNAFECGADVLHNSIREKIKLSVDSVFTEQT